jgi:hypothetical protein
VDPATCAVGRLGPDGPWVGFAPTIDDGYALVVGPPASGGLAARSDPNDPAVRDDLLALVLLYFEEALDPAPDELAATHGDIGALLRHISETEADDARRRALREAVDAVDDGLAADVTISRLGRVLGDATEAVARIRRRVAEVLASA